MSAATAEVLAIQRNVDRACADGVRPYTYMEIADRAATAILPYTNELLADPDTSLPALSGAYQSAASLEVRGQVASLTGTGWPSVTEAIVETCRRTRDLAPIVQVLSGRRCALVLGGSMTYGANFSVAGRSRSAASDVDLVLVVQDRAEAIGLVSAISMLPTFASDQGTLGSIMHICAEWRDSDAPAVGFSMTAWQAGEVIGSDPIRLPEYRFSFTVVDFAEFVSSLSPPSPPNTAALHHRWMDVLRTHQHKTSITDYSFDGRMITRIVEVVRNTGDSVIVRYPVFSVEDGRFYPGVLPNVLLPCGRVILDRLDGEVGRALRRFEQFVGVRLAGERDAHAGPIGQVWLAHCRRDRFSASRKLEIERRLGA